MKKTILGLLSLMLVAALVIKCGGNSPSPTPPAPIIPVTPVTPVVPVVPPAPTFKYSRGFIKPAGHGLLTGAPFILADLTPEIPTAFNWPGAGYDIPVKNQGNCGSCWNFSTTENLEFAVKIFLGKALILSTQSLMQDFYGCNGGYFDGASFEAPKGAYLESDCPYQGNSSACPNGIPIVANAVSVANVGNPDGSSPTIAQIQAALISYGPLSIDVAADGAWDNYQGGVLTQCSSTSINHMVLLLGWDGSGNWLVRNSWGSSWGNKGNITLPYGCDAVASDVATSLVTKVSSVK